MAPRILVADDSVTIQKVVELTFSKENVTLLQARSGEDAIRKAKEERPDLILLDLVMPDKNGYEICTALRADPMLRAVPIILLTGTFEAFDRERAVQVGANDFVTKPFESQQLISKVRQQLFSRTVDVGPPAAPPAPPRAAVPPSAPRAAPAPPVAPGPSVPHEPKEAPPRESVRRPAPPRPAPEARAAPAMSPPTARPLERPATPVAPERIVAPAPSAPAVAATAAGIPGSIEPPSAPRPEPVRDVQAPTSDAAPVRPAPAKPAPPEGAGPMELRLEDLAHVDAWVPAPAPEPLALDDLLGPAEPAIAAGPRPEVEPGAPVSAAGIPAPPAAPPSGALEPLSEGTALEELLASPPGAAGLGARTDQAASEPAPEMPVFDLSADMVGPALPVVEVGKGEPPALSVEDLIGVDGPKSQPPPGQAPFPPGGLGMEPPSSRVPKVDSAFDLTADASGPALPMVEVGKGEPPSLSMEELMGRAEAALVEPPPAGPELEIELPAASPEASASAAQPLSAESTFELEPAFETAPPEPQPLVEELPGIEHVELAAAETERPTAEPSPAASLPGLEPESLFEPVHPVPPPGPVEAAAAPAGAPGLGVEELASMRDAVTERVARELARDLSDKLVERMERIVWEVVPEMAEILIAKEIERIRGMADGQSIS